MKLYILGLIFCRYNPDILWRNKPIDPFNGLPDQGILSHDLQHLFGASFPAQRPKASARPTGKDNGMYIIK
jgi:hypothetical protein